MHWSDMTISGRLQRSAWAATAPGEPYPIEKLGCPLAVFHGQVDYLADCAALVRHLQAQYAAARSRASPHTAHVTLTHRDRATTAACVRAHRRASSSNFQGLRHVEEIPNYEHMDLLWAHDAPQRVFAKVCRLLEDV